MSVTGLDLRNALAKRGALLEGHFRLSSGRHSDRFMQKFRILEDPVLLESVARAIADRFRSLEPTVVVGSAVGGILLATKSRVNSVRKRSSWRRRTASPHCGAASRSHRKIERCSSKTF